MRLEHDNHKHMNVYEKIFLIANASIYLSINKYDKYKYSI